MSVDRPSMPVIMAGLRCFAVGLLALACARPSPAPSPQRVEPHRAVAPPATAPEVEAGAPAPPPVASVRAPRVPTGEAVEVGDWGITIELPPKAQSEHEASAARHRVGLSSLVSVTLHKVPAPAPATLEDADKAWSQGDSVRLDSGVTDKGVLFSVRELTVRIGFPGVKGQTVHTFKQVGRVFAILPLDSRAHVTCTGYVEHGVDSLADPDIVAVRNICLSMRKR